MKEEGTALPTADKLFDMAYEEVVADAMSSMLTDPEVYDKIIELKQQDKTAWERLGEAIKHLITRLRTLLADLAGVPLATAEQRETARFAKETYTQLQDLYAKAFVKADANVAAYEKTTVQDGGERYSLRKGAEQDIENAINGKMNRGDDVYLTESSPPILLGQHGVRNLPMLMKASHVRENILTEEEAIKKGLKVDKHTHYHGLGKDLFIKIIDGLDEVTLAYRGTRNASDSTRRENYFLLISQYQDADGSVVNVPIYIDEYGQYNRVIFDTNKIATVFGRTNFSEYIRKEIESGNLVRITKRNTQASERRAPIALGYNEDVSNSSIPQNPPNVNAFNEKNSFVGREMEDVNIPEEERARYERPVEKELRMLSEKYGVEESEIRALEKNYLRHNKGLQKGKTHEKFVRTLAAIVRDIESGSASSGTAQYADRRLKELATDLVRAAESERGGDEQLIKAKNYIRGVHIQIPATGKGDFDSAGVL